MSHEEAVFMFARLKKSYQQIINRIPFALVRRAHIVDLKKIYELQYVIDSVPCSIFWMDKSFRYLGYNLKQKKLFQMLDPSVFNDGVDHTTGFVGLTIFDLFKEQFSTPLHLNDKVVIENGKEKVFEEHCVDEEGNDLYFLSIKTPKSDENTINGVVGVAIDVSHEKRLEVELKNALQVTKDSMRAKDAFIDSLSHDIRTPLTGILGLIDSLKKRVAKMTPSVLSNRTYCLSNSTQAFLNFFNGILSSVENIEEENKYELMEVQPSIAELKSLFEPALSRERGCLWLLISMPICLMPSYVPDLYSLKS